MVPLSLAPASRPEPKKKPCMYCFPLLCGTASHEMRLNFKGVLPNGTFHFVETALVRFPRVGKQIVVFIVIVLVVAIGAYLCRC
jgi:hypothetical protein